MCFDSDAPKSKRFAYFGTDDVSTLTVAQGAVLAALLWGASDLTLLFIDVGHDVRAARVLLGRMSARMNSDAAAAAAAAAAGAGVRKRPRENETGAIADRQ